MLRQHSVIEILHVPNTGLIIFFEVLRRPSPKRPLTAKTTPCPLEMYSLCHPFSNCPHYYFLCLAIEKRILTCVKSNCALLSRHIEFCNADRTTWDLTLQDITTTPAGPKTKRGVAVDSCFAIIVARQDSVTTDRTEKLSWKDTCSLCFKP